ncbi:acetate--CoA ligase family protein [Nonomuraea sp. NPDC046570]|uniref:acetate--CoA ligase family protein n=1 Tax=Nonomuraea sp. NPDC046570 TaxID=3155255 RepID=UPI0033E9F7F3
MDKLLAPTSIAMVGASNNTWSIGGMVTANLLRAFDGPVHPVHPRDTEIQGRKACPSIADLPEPVDLAVIAVPAGQVLGVVEQAAERGVGGAVILTSGFAEAGPEGKDLQQALADVSARTGIRLIGPNCIGYMNVAGGVMANFALLPNEPLPQPGPVALVSQSGGFGSYLTSKALLSGVRLGWFVTTGNEVDVNLAQTLRFLVERPEVGVLLTFSETLRDPETFIDAAVRAAELGKPMVMLKAGRTEAAAKAALSHTASVTGSAAVMDAVCEQYGVIVAQTMEEMLDLGLIFQDGRRPAGDRIAIMTTSGGAGVLLSDVAAQQGLTVPELPEDEQAALTELMPRPFYGSVLNPVDTTAQITGNPEAYGKVVNAVAGSPSVDMLTTVVWAHPGPAIDTVIDTYRSTTRPLAVLTNAPVVDLTEAGVPTYTDPARAVGSLAALARFTTRPIPARAPYRPDEERRERARALLTGGSPMLECDAKKLLALYGVPVTAEEFVHSPEDAARAAGSIGGPVALKAMSYQLPHKSDAGAVRLGVRDVPGEYAAMLAEVARKAPQARIEGVLVQQMVPARLELTCGMRRDPAFGPMVAAGLGGVLVEILAEAVLLRPPFDVRTARAALDGLAGGRLVSGGRGLSEEEAELVATVMTGLAELALDLPEVDEVDVNPLRVADGAVVAADGLVVISHG